MGINLKNNSQNTRMKYTSAIVLAALLATSTEAVRLDSMITKGSGSGGEDKGEKPEGDKPAEGGDDKGESSGEKPEGDKPEGEKPEGEKPAEGEEKPAAKALMRKGSGSGVKVQGGGDDKPAEGGDDKE